MHHLGAYTGQASGFTFTIDPQSVFTRRAADELVFGLRLEATRTVQGIRLDFGKGTQDIGFDFAADAAVAVTATL